MGPSGAPGCVKTKSHESQSPRFCDGMEHYLSKSPTSQAGEPSAGARDWCQRGRQGQWASRCRRHLAPPSSHVELCGRHHNHVQRWGRGVPGHFLETEVSQLILASSECVPGRHVELMRTIRVIELRWGRGVLGHFLEIEMS
jgi:hypothetical protein